jgi:DNA adenine methylase
MNLRKVQNTQTKPFLRWAGGKNWLVKYLKEILKETRFENYHEPFFGGGSIFFSLQPDKKAFLSDLNKELIKTYKFVKINPGDIISELKKFKNTEDFYYKIREKEFSNPIKNAAKFIYLNQTSFNGIYRVNLKGVYNVPFGYRTKNFLESENLHLVSKRLEKATLFDADFEDIRSNIKKKDLIFLDPPYTVSHNLNGFIKYNQKLFSLEDQHRLSSLIDFIKSKGAYYILSNAAHSKIVQIFDKNDKILKLSRANLIGGINAVRGKTTEYIFTNLK